MIKKSVDQLWAQAVEARIAYGKALRQTRLVYQATRVHLFPKAEYRAQLDAFVEWALEVNHRGIEKLGSKALWNLEQSIRNS